MGDGPTTNAKSEYPPEFRPLAERAVAQISQLQNAAPLSMFAAQNPAGTAGLTPWQTATMSAIPKLQETIAPIEQMQKLGTPVSMYADAMMRQGDTTRAAQGALYQLGAKYGPGGASLENEPERAGRGSRVAHAAVPYLPASQQQESIFRSGSVGMPSEQATREGQGLQALYATPMGMQNPSGVTSQPPGSWGAQWLSPMGQLPPGLEFLGQSPTSGIPMGPSQQAALMALMSPADAGHIESGGGP